MLKCLGSWTLQRADQKGHCPGNIVNLKKLPTDIYTLRIVLTHTCTHKWVLTSAMEFIRNYTLPPPPQTHREGDCTVASFPGEEIGAPMEKSLCYENDPT